MSNTLVDPDDLKHLAGAPFTEDEIDTAVAVLRAACGWHIAPTVDETITLDVMRYQREIRLPTLALVSVDEIRDMTADPDYGVAIDATTYDVSLRHAKIRRHGWWPHGYGVLQIDISHGFPNVPAELMPVITESAALLRRDQTASELGAGPFRVAFADTLTGLASPLTTRSVLNRFLLWQPGMA